MTDDSAPATAACAECGMDFYHLATCSSPETLVQPTTAACSHDRSGIACPYREHDVLCPQIEAHATRTPDTDRSTDAQGDAMNEVGLQRIAKTEAAAKVRDGLCTIWPWNCPNEATLVVYGEGVCVCQPCEKYDDGCHGHAVCDEHGAALRIRQHNQHPRSGTGPPFVVARIHSLQARKPEAVASI